MLTSEIAAFSNLVTYYVMGDRLFVCNLSTPHVVLFLRGGHWNVVPRITTFQLILVKARNHVSTYSDRTENM